MCALISYMSLELYGTRWRTVKTVTKTCMVFQCCLLSIHDGSTFAVVSVSTPITKIYIMYS